MTFRSRRAEPASPTEACRADSYPYPYPTGWYRIASRDSIRPGEVRYMECLGKQFVLWRERESGEVHLMDLRCPHLGADLSRGRVQGDCIECPFHEWRFTGDGRVAHVPYSEHPLDRPVAATHPVTDVHGNLFLFHRCDGSPDDPPPPYELPHLPELDSGKLALRGRRNLGRVGMHLIEIAENGADTAHFQLLHGRFRLPWTSIPIPGFEIVHTAEWQPDPDYPWLMHADDSATLRAFGRQISDIEARVRVTYYGPGGVLFFRFTLPGRGEIVMYQTFLPVGPLEQQVDLRWFADRSLPRLLVWYVIGNWIAQFRQDIEIWEHKFHVPRPKLCRDDGPIYAMRRWYQQFLPGEATGANDVGGGSRPAAGSINKTQP